MAKVYYWETVIADMKIISKEDNDKYSRRLIPASTVWSNGQILMGLEEGKRLESENKQLKEKIETLEDMLLEEQER